METRTWVVVEDNGGGLTLFVFEGETEQVQYSHYGYESDPQQLQEYLRKLTEGADPRTWDGCDATPQADWDALSMDDRINGGWKVIADQDGPIPLERMGAAGQRAFGP